MSFAGYTPWRPLWVLAAFWALALLHLALELAHAYAWLWLADMPLLALSRCCCGAGGRADQRRACCAVLFVGFAWLPLAFALYSAQSVAYALTGEFLLGRAPAHALFVGFFGSLLVAMVTRVTQGHSGRPLVMPKVGVVRVRRDPAGRAAADLRRGAAGCAGVAGACGDRLADAFLPWVLRSAASTWRRAPTASRVDGEAEVDDRVLSADQEGAHPDGAAQRLAVRAARAGACWRAGAGRCSAGTLPSYAIDTALLTAALMLLTILPGAMFANGWLAMKMVLLVVYVVLGTLALKRARSPRSRAVFYARRC